MLNVFGVKSPRDGTNARSSPRYSHGFKDDEDFEQRESLASAEKVRTMCLLLIAIIMSSAALYWLQRVLVPLVLAVMMSYTLAPLVDFCTHRAKVPHGASITIALFFGLGILCSLLFLVRVYCLLSRTFSLSILSDWMGEFLHARIVLNDIPRLSICFTSCVTDFTLSEGLGTRCEEIRAVRGKIDEQGWGDVIEKKHRHGRNRSAIARYPSSKDGRAIDARDVASGFGFVEQCRSGLDFRRVFVGR